MRIRILLAALALAVSAVSARADEGMWTFDNFPASAVKAKYGVSIDQRWLHHVQRSTVRLSIGCSASVVSPEGLVLTNHHCVADCAEDLSSADHDYVKSGFMAGTREDEKQCPGMQAEILLSITDVTDVVNAVTAGKSGAKFIEARDGAVSKLEKDRCKGKEQTERCQVIPLYRGGKYKLYTYRRYADVRLVFAVEQATAFFGGDPDNFNFPRYDLDFSFLKLYDRGRPASTPDHLTWSTMVPQAGEPVFVAGNPGGTDRLLTVAQLEMLRDMAYPPMLIEISELRGRLIRFTEENAEHARIATETLFGVENNLKAMRGEEEALRDADLIAAKREAEDSLKAKVAANPKLAAETGDAWGEIAQVQIVRKELYPRYTMLEGRAGRGSDLYRYARMLVRGAAERLKPNEKRLPEYADAQLPQVEKALLDARPIEPELEQLKLEFWLSKLREALTADSPETTLYLGKNSPEALSAALAQSKLADPGLRKRLWERGMAAVRASDDPMIRFVLKTDAAARAVRKDYEARVTGPTDRAAERIAKARFALYGTSVYPDATFSLRLSYGAIAGWDENGKTIAPFTYFSGLFARATGQPPFDLAPRWADAGGKVCPDTVFNIASTNDIIGGNSGSPLIDAKGEVVGAIFDGNIHSLGGDFFFDRKLNRAVSVSTASITEALAKVYGDSALLKELGVR